MTLPPNYARIFARDCFTFKQLKEQLSPEEINLIKEQYKSVWQAWKQLHLTIYSQFEHTFERPKIESWTNGWNLRNHFWAAYRLKGAPSSNACLGVLINRKQLQIYLMFQHYKSEQRLGLATDYNQLLQQIPTWSQTIDLTHYQIWPQQEHELTEHLKLKQYLNSANLQEKLQAEITNTSFQVGKVYKHDLPTEKIEQAVVNALSELLPLLQACP